MVFTGVKQASAVVKSIEAWRVATNKVADHCAQDSNLNVRTYHLTLTVGVDSRQAAVDRLAKLWAMVEGAVGEHAQGSARRATLGRLQWLIDQAVECCQHSADSVPTVADVGGGV